MTNPTSTPDAAPGNWVTRAPRAAQPYLRLMRADRPIGTWLLLIPCWWGLTAGMQNWNLQVLWYALLFTVGAYVMRGAGCAYNDIVDHDIDAKVERTALRPLPAGEISVKQAWAFLIALCLIGLLVLLQFNRLTIIIGLCALVLVAIYPFMKRITYWPQAWLGLTFNWGALVGYAAINGALDPAAFVIYGAGFFWTLGYDTIYAHQDKEDDAMIGVRSTALRLGDDTKPWLAGFFGATLIGFGLAGWLMNVSAVYYLALIPAAVHFLWQWRILDINDAHNCLRLFKSNRDAGLLLLLAPICERLTGLI